MHVFQNNINTITGLFETYLTSAKSLDNHIVKHGRLEAVKLVGFDNVPQCVGCGLCGVLVLGRSRHSAWVSPQPLFIAQNVVHLAADAV